MKLNTRKMLLGLSLLGATSLVGFSAPAFADDDDDRKDRRKEWRKDRREDIKDARKDVKDARKDVRDADSREERRDAWEDLREEQRDLREERRENGRRPGYGNSSRPNYGNSSRPGYGRPNGYGRPTYGRPDYNRPTYGRPGYSYGQPNWNRPNNGRPTYSNSTRTIEGVVTSDLRGNDFVIRTSSGQTVRVVALRGESGRIDRGDIVRVSGSFSGNTLNARTVSILRDR